MVRSRSRTGSRYFILGKHEMVLASVTAPGRYGWLTARFTPHAVGQRRRRGDLYRLKTTLEVVADRRSINLRDEHVLFLPRKEGQSATCGLASIRPIMLASTSHPSAALRSRLSWRGCRSASASGATLRHLLPTFDGGEDAFGVGGPDEGFGDRRWSRPRSG